MSGVKRVANIDDLRIKLCYICREEESYDKPADPPRKWVHPCRCTLIAHEDCLLEWIRTSENNPDRQTSNFLKCPQCGAKYELDSENPMTLRIMDVGNDLLTLVGHGAAVITIGAVFFSLGSGVYVLCTGYGAYALEKLIGREMFDYYLTDNPAVWSLSEYINLPLIPLSLILSRTKRFASTLPINTMFMILPASGPAVPPTSIFIRPMSNVTSSGRPLLSFRDIFLQIPPSPIVFQLGYPILRTLYNRLLRRIRRAVLGDDADREDQILRNRGGVRGVDRVVMDNFRMEMRIEDDIVRPEDAGPAPAPGAPNAPIAAVDDDDMQIADGDNVRLVLDDPAPNAAGAPAARDREGRVNENQDRGRPVQIRMSAASIGRLVGGALLIPPIASFMGDVLLRLALPRGLPHTAEAAKAWYDYRARRYKTPSTYWSPRYWLLRFLAVRPPGLAARAPTAAQWFSYAMEKKGVAQFTSMMKIIFHMMFVGTAAWTEADPVWWRNTIGLSLFYVAKDSISLWYAWMSQREIRSRKLKDRSFAGIDPAELDLKPETRALFTADPSS